MRVLKAAVVVSLLVGAAACGRDAEPKATARSNDLTWLDSLGVSDAPVRAALPAAASATELGLAASDSAAKSLVATAPAPEAKKAESTTRRTATRRSTSTRRRSSGSSSGTYSGNGGYESSGTYRAPTAVVKRNTRRDAVIGAGAGAVIGAVAGGRNHRVRGAVIGAVAGGAAGAIIGHHVDKKTVYVP